MRGGTRRAGSARAARALLVVALVATTLLGTTGSARGAVVDEPQVTSDIRVPMSDGVELAVKLGGRGPLVNGVLPARPTIVELSPYRPGCCTELAGPEYNYLEVHLRGTGDSDGSFDALGDRTQLDVSETLDWACQQPWSNGRLGLYGFSASAIVVYNSLHVPLPCVQTAVLGAGTHELYRDLMYPGGIPNLVPAIGVLALIGAPSIQAGPDRLGRDPISSVNTFDGMFDVGLSYVQHPTLDAWWRERGMRGDVNHLPILMVTGFYDVESRGPFQTFQELRGDGAHLMVVGAHDGVPVGSGGSDGERQRWFDRYLRDDPNGVESDPAVELWMSDGGHTSMLAGDFVTAQGTDWPIPGTQWTSLTLDAARSGTATSLNDGTLHTGPAPAALQPYVEIPSLPTATDPHTTALLGAFNGSETLTDMSLVEPLGLSYTTAPFATDVLSAGPASLELVLSSTAPSTDIYTVISDVAPDGTAHPVATGRLNTEFPGVDLSRSLVDGTGAIVQPYATLDQPDPAPIGQERRYHVELWPIGNRFQAGHRLRLHIVGASGFSQPALPAVNTVRLGGDDGSRLLLPVLPASDGSTTLAFADTTAGGAALPVTGGSSATYAVLALVALLTAIVLRRARA